MREATEMHLMIPVLIVCSCLNIHVTQTVHRLHHVTVVHNTASFTRDTPLRTSGALLKSSCTTSHVARLIDCLMIYQMGNAPLYAMTPTRCARTESTVMFQNSQGIS